MTQPMRSARWKPPRRPAFPNVFADDILRQRRTVFETQHTRALEMTMVVYGRCQSRRHRDVSQPAALGHCYVPTPLRPPDAHLTFHQISPEPVRLVAVPAEQRILDKLAWPLRHAKASYMVGNYLAVIALYGMAEMVACDATHQPLIEPLCGRSICRRTVESRPL
jgi:hypothetical protein